MYINKNKKKKICHIIFFNIKTKKATNTEIKIASEATTCIYIKNCEGSWVENGFYPWSTWSAWSYCSVGMTNKTNDMEVLCEGLGDSYAGGVNGHSTIYAKKCWFSYPEDSNKKAIEGELVSGQAEQTCDQYGIRKISKEFVKNQSCRCRYK